MGMKFWKASKQVIGIINIGKINNIFFLGERVGYQAGRKNEDFSLLRLKLPNKTVVIVLKHIHPILYVFLLRCSIELNLQFDWL